MFNRETPALPAANDATRTAATGVRRLVVIAATALCAVALPRPGSAANYTWSGNGSGVNWNTGANWAGTAPADNASTNLIFGGTNKLGTSGTPLNQNIAPSFTFNSLTFDATAGHFYLGGQDFDGTAPTIVQDSSSDENIDNNIVYGGNGSGTLTLSGNGTGIVYLTGTLSGKSAGTKPLNITKNGTSTFALSGTTSTIGTTTITAGTLDFLTRASLYGGTASSWTRTNIIVDSGATLAVGVGDAASGYFDAANLTILLNSTHLGNSNSTAGLRSGANIGLDTTNATGGNFTYSTAISNPGANVLNLVKLGAGNLTLSGANTYTGTTTVSAGTLKWGASNVIPGALVLNGNTTADLAGFSDTVSALTINAGNSTVKIQGSTSTAPLAVSGALTKTGNLTIDVTGTATTAGLYKLLGYGSATGSGTVSASNVNAAYTLLNSGTEYDLQHKADQTLTRLSAASFDIITGGTATVSANLLNAAPTGSANLAVALADNGSTGGTLSAFTGTGPVAAGANLTVGATFTANNSIGSGKTWSLTNTDPNAITSSVTTNGTVNVYDHASGSAGNTTIALADAIVGYTGTLGGQSNTTISNAGGFRVNLKTTGSTTAGNVSINNVSGIAAGGSAAISAGLANGQSAGAISQLFTLTYADDSLLNGANSNLGNQTITVTGNVYNHASGSAGNTTIALADAIVGYTGTLGGQSNTTISNAGGYRVNLKTTGSTTAGGVSINNVSGIAAGGSGTISAGLANGQSAGAISQLFTLTYADDSLLNGASANLGNQTVTVTGNVYNHASGSAGNTTIALADAIVGYTGTLGGQSNATISNAGGYRVNLKTTGSTTAGNVTINNVSGIAAGGSAAISAGLANGQSAGAISQLFTLTYADDSLLNGANSNLGNQTITVTGNVYNHASGSAGNTTIALADAIVGYTGTLGGQSNTTISNAGGYRVNLKTTGSTTAGGVSINNVSGIAAGGSGTISAGLANGQGAGAINQLFTLTYADDSTLNGANSNLGNQTIAVTGNVYDHASGSAGNTTIALADAIVGYTGTLGGQSNTTISNAGGYRVNLKTTGSTTAGGVSINNVSGIAAGGSAAISASLANGQSVGAVNQVFTLTYADDSTLNGANSNLGNQTITVTGNVLDHANASFDNSNTPLATLTIDFGHVLARGNATVDRSFTIYNVAANAAAAYTADLTYNGTYSGTIAGVTTDLNNASGNLVAGAAGQQYHVTLDTSNSGAVSGSYVIGREALLDANLLPGAGLNNTDGLTVIVTGTVGQAPLGTAITATVAANSSLAGLGSQSATASPTQAQLLAGTAPASGAVSMTWRDKTAGETMLLSAALDLTIPGFTNGIDSYVLSMSYDPSLTEAVVLGYLNTSDQWVFAGSNPGANLGAWQPSYTTPGMWGVDTIDHLVWAALDHNSQFGVINSVPEPSTVAILVGASVVGGCGIWRRRRRMKLGLSAAPQERPHQAEAYFSEEGDEDDDEYGDFLYL